MAGGEICDDVELLCGFHIITPGPGQFPTRLLSWNSGNRIIRLFQLITGVWLMYCTYAMTVDLALGAKAWI